MNDAARWVCHRHHTIDSTSDEARRLVAAGGSPPRFVVWADRQTKGRGRGSNAWWSDSGSLTVTLGIDPRHEGIPPRQEPKLSLAAGLACIQALAPLVGPAICLRWPNDVEVEGRKLAGCLVERVESPDGPRILIGIGVNVLTNFDKAPADVRELATSIADRGIVRITGPTSGRWRYYVLLRLLRHVDFPLGLLRGDEATFDRIINDYDSLEGRHVRIRQGSHLIEGIGRGINPDGSLKLETLRGVLSIYGGQVLRNGMN